MESKAIELVQNPIIKHEIAKIGKSVTERIDALNLENQVVTEDTIQSLKKLRAELNKEHAEYNGQFKAVSDVYMQPINDVKLIYKSEISEKYAAADSTLKDKLGIFENQVKANKRAAVEVYFNELCIAEKIDFVKFEQVIPEVNLTITEKKYKEQVNEFINKIIDDLNLIKTVDFEAETLTEYKLSLNASKAITDVKTRKENEAKEAARIKAEETAKRQLVCKSLNMVWVDITNAYEFDAEIYISKEEIVSLSKEDFQKKVAECEVAIANKKAAQVTEQVQSTEQPEAQQAPITTPPKVVKPSEPLQAPTIEIKEDLKKARFEVTATMTQLRALGAYMKANNIIYTNI